MKQKVKPYGLTLCILIFVVLLALTCAGLSVFFFIKDYTGDQEVEIWIPAAGSKTFTI